jgi:hypothetical protein
MDTATVPVNFRKQDSSPAAIARAVDYAICVADGYISQWAAFTGRLGQDSPHPLTGLRVLELGPGATLGIPVLLACAGARVAVADRFPSYWDADFHPAFFEALLRRVGDRSPRFGQPIRELLVANRFVPDVVQSFALGAESLHSIGRTFDLVLSNAVIEHVEDLRTTATNLAAITTPGGAGLHQVDFRDHRNFDEPLEYLTLAADDFAELRRSCFCECGCQWRVSDVIAAFQEAGFDVRTHVNLHTTPEYLARVRPRLQPEFAARPDHELLATSALFLLSRRG